MHTSQIYYLQQMGYTVWRQREVNQLPACHCTIATQGLGQATLLCCLDKKPTKAEKDLWMFLAMAFDFSQKYYLTASSSEPIENTVCPPCIGHWLHQSRSHHAIVFGDFSNEDGKPTIGSLLITHSLSEMIEHPNLKKECFTDIQNFLCQQPIVV